MIETKTAGGHVYYVVYDKEGRFISSEDSYQEARTTLKTESKE